MSKFIDILQQTLRGAAPPIGFRKIADTEGHPLVVAVNLSALGRKDLKYVEGKHIQGGVLGTQGLDTATFEQWKNSLPGTPLGLIMESDSSVDVGAFIDLGCDFFVCGLKTPLELINQEKVGKVVIVEPTMESGLVRSLNDLPVDAVLVNTAEPTITIEQVLVCYRFAAIVSKPLLVTIRAPLTRDTVESLQQAGVNGLFLDTSFPPAAISDLHKAVKDLPRAPRRRRPSAIPLLPRPTSGIETETEEEEEED